MTITRRTFLQHSGLVALMMLLSRHSCAKHYQNRPKACALRGGLAAYGIDLLRSSGNQDLDRSINLELQHISSSLNVLPGFGFYDDTDELNAFALDETVIPNTNGTVIFGKNLLLEELNAHEWGGLAIAGIMAHEFAHIYQYQSSFYQALTRGQDTDKYLELHADYLAGYYLGLKRLRAGEIDIKAFFDSMYLKGDNDFNASDHHGTPEERGKVVLAGYKMGLSNNRDLTAVATTGLNFVQTL